MKTIMIIAPALLALSTLNVQLSTCFAQGSLTPPGAPAPTMLTLSLAELMVETLAGLAAGTLAGRKQADAQATLARILTREDGAIDFTRMRGRSTIAGGDFSHGRERIPGCAGKNLIVHRMRVGAESGIEAGLLRVAGDEMSAGCAGRSSVLFDEVQMEGKRRMSAAEFLRGFQVKRARGLGFERSAARR